MTGTEAHPTLRRDRSWKDQAILVCPVLPGLEVILLDIPPEMEYGPYVRIRHGLRQFTKINVSPVP